MGIGVREWAPASWFFEGRNTPGRGRIKGGGRKGLAMSERLRVAIDGPAGAGKSTVAKILASRLRYTYVDTGAMYRAVTYLALKEQIDIDVEDSVCRWLQTLRFDLEMTYADGVLGVQVNGYDVTEAIRSALVSDAVTTMAKYPCVREFLFWEQKRLAARPGVVMDGRDIGTVIMPQAEVKFFLVASLRERALRRQAELQGRGDLMPLAAIEQSIARRDTIDANRDSAPLTQADDAVLIDTTHLDIEQVVQVMLDHIRRVKEVRTSAVRSGQDNS